LPSQGKEPGSELVLILQRRLRGDHRSGVARLLGRIQFRWRFPPTELDLRRGEQFGRLVDRHAEHGAEVLAANPVPVDKLENLPAVRAADTTREFLAAREGSEPGSQLIRIRRHRPGGAQRRLGHARGDVIAPYERPAVVKDTGSLALELGKYVRVDHCGLLRFGPGRHGAGFLGRGSLSWQPATN
jgi:hypothetical protein